MKILNIFFSFAFFAIIALSFSSCVKDSETVESHYYSDQELEVLQKELSLPNVPHEYSFDLPTYFSGSKVRINNAEATLGRVLFYDHQLSKTQEVSCASCHKAELGFSDDKAFSEGINGHVTERNSLALGAFISFNAYYSNTSTRLFWDERANSLEEQIPETLGNSLEMDMNFEELIPLLEDDEHYTVLFNKAYGSPAITSNKISDAMSAFVNSIHASRSKFDKAHNKEGANISGIDNFSEFTDQENRGKALFTTNCGSCHAATIARSLIGSTPTTGFGGSFIAKANNGLDMVYTDKGVGELSGSYENGVFKIPSLRNVTLTAPYMHDGRFNTIEDVIEFYNSGIKNHANLSDQLKSTNGQGVKQMNFSQTDKDDIIAFLHTLSDTETVNHERFANPFKD